MASVEYLSLEDLLEIGHALIPELRVRDLGLLESASQRPQMSVYGEDAYPEFAEKVASLMHSIARNHSLMDGNKRLAWSGGRIFCLMNNKDLKMDIDDAEKLILEIARGEIDVKEIAERISGNIR